MNLEEKVKDLEQRVAKIEHLVFAKRNKGSLTSHADAGSQLPLESLKIPSEILSPLQEQIRKVSYWNLVLVLLHFAPHPLKYADIMNLCPAPKTGILQLAQYGVPSGKIFWSCQI